MIILLKRIFYYITWAVKNTVSPGILPMIGVFQPLEGTEKIPISLDKEVD